MGQPESVRLVFTVLFAGVTLTCVVRLLSARAGLPAPATTMSATRSWPPAMIVMVLSWTSLLPTSVWVLLFGGQAAYFAAILLLAARPGNAARTGKHTHHFVGSLGMLYMVVVLGDAAMVSMSPLAVSFGLYFLVYGVWSAAVPCNRFRSGTGCWGRPLLVQRLPGADGWRHGLPVAGVLTVLRRADEREQHGLADGRARQHHQQPVDAHAEATGRRHAVFQCA